MSRQWRSDDTDQWLYGFGNGSDGDLTISSNTTEAPIDASCAGTIGTTSLSATNASFAPGQLILIHQSRGNNIERKSVNSITRSGTTVTVTTSASHGYLTGNSVQIVGASQTEYNGHWEITVTGASTFTFQISTTPTTPATGTILVTKDNWELNKIASYTAGTITLSHPLQDTYVDSGAAQAQVRVMRQYNNVTINSGVTLSAKAWTGDVGGILGFFAKGTVTVAGNISANQAGYLGASTRPITSGNHTGYQGEGNLGARDTISRNPNGNGGGGGVEPSNNGGGGAGHGLAGTNGQTSPNGGLAGVIADHPELTTMVFGGGGGSGCGGNNNGTGGAGGRGGGLSFIFAANITVTGSITHTGGNGANGSTSVGGGGGGAGGASLIKCIDGVFGTNLITALAGAGSTGASRNGGAGAVGRNHVDYSGSISGTTNPALSNRLDATIISTLLMNDFFFFL